LIEKKLAISKIKISPEAKKYLSNHSLTEINLREEDLTTKAKEIHSRAREISSKVFIIDPKKSKSTQKIDKVLLHPISGAIIFFAIFFFNI
jgi:Fe2+ transport system protein B